MREFFASRIRSFRYAFQGWGYVLRTQRNAWIHSAIATVVFLVGLWLKLTLQEWAIIVLTAAFVFSAEFINTAIEAAIDIGAPDPHPMAKIGKDVASTAALVSSIVFMIIVALILVPAIVNRVSG